MLSPVRVQSRAAKWLLDHDQEEEGLVWAKRALEYPGGHPPTARILADYYTRKGNPAQANYYRLQAGSAAPAPAPSATPGAGPAAARGVTTPG